jgi:transposase-like protein
MSTKRKSYSSEQKARIALEAVKGFTSINDIAKEFKVHPNQISLWKRQLLENLPLVFDTQRGPKTEANTDLIDQLYRQVGKLQVELEWLKKKYEPFS